MPVPVCLLLLLMGLGYPCRHPPKTQTILTKLYSCLPQKYFVLHPHQHTGDLILKQHFRNVPKLKIRLTMEFRAGGEGRKRDGAEPSPFCLSGSLLSHPTSHPGSWIPLGRRPAATLSPLSQACGLPLLPARRPDTPPEQEHSSTFSGAREAKANCAFGHLLK